MHNTQHTQYSQVTAYRTEQITKSPVHLHGQANLATLAQVTYTHKQIAQLLPPPSAGGIAQISPRMNGAMYQSAASLHRYPPAPSPSPSPHPPRTAHVYSSASTTSNTGVSSGDFTPAQSQQPTTHKYMPLPRADMKPYLESYFADEKAMILQQQQINQAKGVIDEKPRTISAPLEGKFSYSNTSFIRNYSTIMIIVLFCSIVIGLAASLQARIVAQMKIKEEHEKRSEITSIPMINGSLTITPTQQIKIEGKLHCDHYRYYYLTRLAL